MTVALLLTLALTGCRLLEQTRQTAANALAVAVVRSMFEMQSRALTGVPSRPPLNRSAVRLAFSPPAAAAAVVDRTDPAKVPETIAAVAPSPLPKAGRRVFTVCLKRGVQFQHVLQLCKTRVVIRLDENGNVSM